MNDPDAEALVRRARMVIAARHARVSELNIEPNEDDAGGSALAAAIARLAGEPSTARVADALHIWVDAGDGVTLESCLGLGSTYRSARRRQRRDRLLQQIAVEHFPGLSGRPLANAIDRAIADYQIQSSWQRDRRSGNRRSGLPGLLFELLALGAPLLSEESIRTLLGKRRLRKTHPRSDDLPQISKATHGDSE